LDGIYEILKKIDQN